MLIILPSLIIGFILKFLFKLAKYLNKNIISREIGKIIKIKS